MKECDEIFLTLDKYWLQANLMKIHFNHEIDLLLASENYENLTNYRQIDQLQFMLGRRQQLGEVAIKAEEHEWQKIFDQLRELREKKQPPSCSEVQTLIERSEEMLEQYTGGNTALKLAIYNMYEAEGRDRISQGGLIIDKETFAYYKEACDFMKGNSFF